jgi:hypothetical protein
LEPVAELFLGAPMIGIRMMLTIARPMPTQLAWRSVRARRADDEQRPRR